MRCLSRARPTLWTSAVIVLLACGPLGPFALAHAGAADDPGCDERGVGAAGSAATTPEVDGGRSAASPDHCAVCHWLHLLRGAAPRGDAVARPALGASDLVYDQSSGPSVACSFPCSGRSPPSTVR